MSLENTKMINKIMSDWYSLPLAVKENILNIDKGSGPLDYPEEAYKHFITVLDGGDALTTNSFKKLKRQLFCLY